MYARIYAREISHKVVDWFLPYYSHFVFHELWLWRNSPGVKFPLTFIDPFGKFMDKSSRRNGCFLDFVSRSCTNVRNP